MRAGHLGQLLHLHHERGAGWDPETEDQAVRQYRYLLRTAPLDALESAHLEALGAMAVTRRRAVLDAVVEGLLAGERLTPHDVRPLAHLLTVGERHEAGAFLRACEPRALLDLAERVILAEASFGLFSGYAAWDGSEPRSPQVPADSAWGERWHDRLVADREGTGRRRPTEWDHV